MEIDIKFGIDTLTIDVDIQPEEKMTHDYPGCSAEIESINSVEFNGQDITAILENCNVDFEEAFDDLIWQALEDKITECENEKAEARYEAMRERREAA